MSTGGTLAGFNDLTQTTPPPVIVMANNVIVNAQSFITVTGNGFGAGKYVFKLKSMIFSWKSEIEK